ncbi:TPA: hypothetical protein EYP13_01640, partial [Candidatus Micrarchaeota archaeon]|nr:hypothetical protein [Candidatus Micrarchaeota archaeon]
MRKKLAASLLVLAVLGIFAGLAVAQSGAVTAVLRLNTNDGSLGVDTVMKAKDFCTDNGVCLSSIGSG